VFTLRTLQGTLKNELAVRDIGIIILRATLACVANIYVFGYKQKYAVCLSCSFILPAVLCVWRVAYKLPYQEASFTVCISNHYVVNSLI
jgi:hypothetical protein